MEVKNKQPGKDNVQMITCKELSVNFDDLKPLKHDDHSP